MRDSKKEFLFLSSNSVLTGETYKYNINNIKKLFLKGENVIKGLFL